MFDVRKPKQSPIVVIRAATGSELSNYEKNKLATIEDNAQENKIEVISINGVKQQVNPLNKEVTIDLGNLAFKHKVAPDDISTEDLFLIKCELDEAAID